MDGVTHYSSLIYLFNLFTCLISHLLTENMESGIFYFLVSWCLVLGVWYWDSYGYDDDDDDDDDGGGGDGGDDDENI